MTHASMLKARRKKQTVRKQTRRTQKQARRDYFAGKVARSAPQAS